MVLLPETPQHIFQNAMKTWGSWRDGDPVIPSHLTYNGDDLYVFEIRRDFTSKDGLNINYKEGMLGICLYEGKYRNLVMARIFIQVVTEHGLDPGEQNAWIPRNDIRRGPR